MAITVVLVLLLLIHGDREMPFAGAVATFKVGGEEGWTIDQARTWPKGRSFKGGDYLEFQYNYEWVNVIVANRAEYEACKLPIRGGSSAYQTGHDYVPLKRGHNYFFSDGIVGQCRQGFKMIIVAE